MWRRNELRFGEFSRENQDSDQSISEEEEELEGERTGNAISLDGSRDNKGAVQVMSQLEMLRDSYVLHSTEKELIPYHERKIGYHTDDEVEISLLDEGDGSRHYPRIAPATHTKPNEGMVYLPTLSSISHSDEIISDDEKINPPALGSARENLNSTWSEASREVEALVCLNENSSCPTSHGVFVKERKSSRGGGGGKRFKPKFVFRPRSRKEYQSMVASDRHDRTSSDCSPPPDEIGAASDEDMGEFMLDSEMVYHDKESVQPENSIVPFEVAHKHDFRKHSMVDFLYNFDESSNQPRESSELHTKKRGRRAQLVLKRNSSLLGDRNLCDDDPVEGLDSGSPFSSDDEENYQKLNLVIPRRTMADQFHEAFETVAVIDEKPHVTFSRPLGNGMYGKLQQVMQSEKERDMDYLKNQSVETGFKDESICISVRILTRSLEAKLIVCSCIHVEDGKNLYMDSNLQMKMKGGVARTLIIIFNPRICSDVELEIGNLICISPPWKEVPVKGKDDVIYLCSYFTRVHP